MYCIYGFAGLWVDNRSTSPAYVLPYIVLTDLGVLSNLHNAKVKRFIEVIFSFFVLLGSRILVVYLAWQDRHPANGKPGAYELIEPTFYLLITCLVGKHLSSVYWQSPKANPEEVLAEDRHCLSYRIYS